jgi:hypothetical protein
MWTTAHQSLLERFAASFPPPMADDECRVWTVALAEQFRFDFPKDRWGTKRASPSRPQSTDCICTQLPFVGYDVIISQGRPDQHLAVNPEPLDLTGQVYISVTAKDHLGPAPKPEPTVPPKPAPAYPDEQTFWTNFESRVTLAYADAGRVFPDHSAGFRVFSRCGFDIGVGMAPNAAADKHIGELRKALGV